MLGFYVVGMKIIGSATLNALAVPGSHRGRPFDQIPNHCAPFGVENRDYNPKDTH
jgi:hypothetical protein